MTISSDTNKIAYTGDNATVEFIYDFLVPLAADMTVTLDDVIQSTGYTVNGAGNDAGGDVTFDVAPGAGVKITLIRELDITQEMDLRPYDAFPADTVEDAFDKLTMISQDIQEQVDRSVTAPASDDGSTDYTMPVFQAGSAITWDDPTKQLVNSEFPLQQYVNDASNSAAAASSSEANSAASATTSMLEAWEAEANQLTSDSYATKAEDVFVTIYTSNGDGTFTATPSTDYSALHWAAKALENAAEGEANTSSNLGGGAGLAATKAGVDLPFKSLVAGANISLASDANTVTVSATSAGESNTTSNAGAGEGLAKAKAGVDLPIKSLVAGNNITLAPGADTVTIAASAAGSANIPARNCALNQDPVTQTVPGSDTLNLVQNTVLSFANGFDTEGQLDTQENIGAGVSHTLGVGHESKNYWFYKDLAGSYGVSEKEPHAVLTKADLDTWGRVSDGDAALKSPVIHETYSSSSGIVLASAEFSTAYAWGAFNTGVFQWIVTSITTSWLRYQNTEERVLKSWRFKESETVGRLPERFTIEGSDDGTTWVAIDSTYTSSNYTGNGVDTWGNLQSVSGNTTPYLYFRINITQNGSDATYTAIADMEFNSERVGEGSDYYMVEEGQMYNDSDVAIDRVYLAEVITDGAGDVSSYTNLPVAKQNFTEIEVQERIIAPNVASGFVVFDGTISPPLILDSFNVSDITDLGVGNYEINLINPGPNGHPAVASISTGFNFMYDDTTNSIIHLGVQNASHASFDSSRITVIIY